MGTWGLVPPSFGGHLNRMYSKVSIIRPGCSRLLEFEKKIVLIAGNIDFFQISRPGRLIETKRKSIEKDSFLEEMRTR